MQPGLTNEIFAGLMARLGPFEASPRLAVAVSGGPDSLALTLLAHDWAAEHGGTIDALTVDHGLRPESSSEAGQVGAILSRRSIRHTILRWDGTKPATGIQAAARVARYALLEGWCEEAGVLHLLLAHHIEDQAETILMRLGRGSGPMGLAGMSAVVEKRSIRLLRPLLGVPKHALRALVEAAGEAAVDDPSNEHPAFLRGRLRAAMPILADGAFTAPGIAETGRRMGEHRRSHEAQVAAVLAATVAMRREGYARIGLRDLAVHSTEVRQRVLAAVAIGVGGLDRAPRLARLERLSDAVFADDGRTRTLTLGGCLFRRAQSTLIVCREPECVEPPVALSKPATFVWDRRFRVRVAGVAGAEQGLVLRALGPEGWHAVRPAVVAEGGPALPHAVRLALPSLWDVSGVLAVPHLVYGRVRPPADSLVSMEAVFEPRQPLQGGGFMLV